MTLLHEAPLWAQALLIALLLLAATQDVLRRRISNLLCAAVAIAALAAAVATGPNFGLWQNLTLFAAILLLGVPLFAAGWLGGADVKLLAGVGLWVDFRTVLPLLACIFIAGGVIAFGSLVVRVRAAKGTNKGIPYGVAIACGVTAMLIGPSLLEQRLVEAGPMTLNSARGASEQLIPKLL